MGTWAHYILFAKNIYFGKKIEIYTYLKFVIIIKLLKRLRNVCFLYKSPFLTKNLKEIHILFS